MRLLIALAICGVMRIDMNNHDLECIEAALVEAGVDVQTDSLLDRDDPDSQVAYLDLRVPQGSDFPYAKVQEVLAHLGVLLAIDLEGSHKGKPGWPAFVVELLSGQHMTLRDINYGKRTSVNNWTKEQGYEEPPF